MKVTQITRGTAIFKLLRQLRVNGSGARLTLANLRQEWVKAIRLRESDLTEAIRELMAAGVLQLVDDPTDPAIEVTARGARMMDERYVSKHSLLDGLRTQVVLAQARSRVIRAAFDASNPKRRLGDRAAAV